MHTNAPFFKTLKCLNLLKFTNFLDYQMLSRLKRIEILQCHNKFQVNILNSSQNESQIKTKKVKLEREKSHLANWLQKKSKTVFPKCIISFPKYRTSFLNAELHFKNADLHFSNAELHFSNVELQLFSTVFQKSELSFRIQN